MVKSKFFILILISFIFINSIILISALPDYFDWRNKDGHGTHVAGIIASQDST